MKPGRREVLSDHDAGAISSEGMWGESILVCSEVLKKIRQDYQGSPDNPRLIISGASQRGS